MKRWTCCGARHCRALPTAPRPSVTGKKLLYSVTDDNLRGDAGVYAVDSKSGRRDWHVRTDTSVKNTVAVSDDGIAVATSVAGRVHGIDAAFWATRLEPRSTPIPWKVDIHSSGHCGWTRSTLAARPGTAGTT